MLSLFHFETLELELVSTLVNMKLLFCTLYTTHEAFACGFLFQTFLKLATPLKVDTICHLLRVFWKISVEIHSLSDFVDRNLVSSGKVRQLECLLVPSFWNSRNPLKARRWLKRFLWQKKVFFLSIVWIINFFGNFEETNEQQRRQRGIFQSNGSENSSVNIKQIATSCKNKQPSLWIEKAFEKAYFDLLE